MYEKRKEYSVEQTIEYNCGKFGAVDKKRIKKILDRFNNPPYINPTKTVKLPRDLLASINYVSRLSVDDTFNYICPKEVVEDKYSGLPQEPYIKTHGEWVFKDIYYFRTKLKEFLEKKNIENKCISIGIDIGIDFIIHNYNYKTRFFLKKISFYEWVINYQLPKENNKGFEFEVAVAHYFQHKKIKCNNCDCANIELAGGSGNPYVDMKCKCGALFEIKSKKQVMIKLIINKRRRIYGGSFRHYKELEKMRKKKNLPHYIVLVGSDTGNIYIGKITKINIKLCKESLVCSIPQIKSIINFDNFNQIGNFDINKIPSCKEEDQYYISKKQYIYEKLEKYIIIIQNHIRIFLRRKKNSNKN